jgi:hypothetical protein
MIPGLAIAALALAAVLMTIRAIEPASFSRGEQIVWLVITFCLFFVEVRAILNDRTEFTVREAMLRVEERSHHEQQMNKLIELGRTEDSLLSTERELSMRPPLAAVVYSPLIVNKGLRERSLLVASNMLQFILGRQQSDPFSGQYPSFVAVGAGVNGTNMPAYGKETLALFDRKFGLELKGIYDEFSVLGLGRYTTLESVSRDSALAISGNPYAALRGIADDIRNLASLLPLQNMYSKVSDAHLAEEAIDEADKIDALAQVSLAQLRAGPDADAVRFFFSTHFDQCCRDHLSMLRNELMVRLGPSDHDPREMELFSELMDKSLAKSDSRLSTVVFYAPYLKALGDKLKTHSEQKDVH